MTVIEVVERERQRVHRLHLVAGVALVIAASATLLALGAMSLGDARWLALPRPVPLLIWVVIAAADGAVVWWTAKRLRAEATRSRIAEAIEREQSLREGQLRVALEVANSGALGRHAASTLGRRLGDAGPLLAPTLRKRARGGVLRAGAAALVTAALLGWAAPLFDDGLLAILRPVRAWQGTLLPSLGFDALPDVVMRNEPLRVRIVAPGRQSVVLHTRTTGEGWRTMSLTLAPGATTVEASLGPVGGEIALVVDDGRSRSDTATIRVTERPFVGGVVLTAIYPRYLGRASEGLAVGEPARVPQGTIIEVSGRASTALRSAYLVGTGDSVAMRADGHTFGGRLEAMRSGRYQWRALGGAGLIPDVPPPLELLVVPDSAPRVELIDPSRDTIAATDGAIVLRATASDDHGIGAVEMVTWRVGAGGEREPSVTQRLAGAASTEWAGQTELSLAARGLQPGDALHARIVAIDDSPWAQRGESRELVIRVPTMEERRTNARTSADSAVEAARSLAAAQKNLEQRTSDASRERGERGSSQGRSNESAAQGATSNADRSQQMSYQTAEKARGIAKEQRELADQMQKLRESAQQLERELRGANALDSSLQRQLRDVQQLLRDAMTPEMQEQMRKLEEASQRLDGNDARQAMRDLAKMQQELREKIEKSAEMLKRAAIEGSMQTLQDEAKDIAKEQRELAQNPQGKGERAPDEAERLADRAERFEKDVSDLQKRLDQQKAQAGAQQTEEARRHADASERAMRDAAESMKEQSPQRESGERAAPQKAAQGKKGEGTEGQPGSEGKPDSSRTAGEKAGEQGTQRPDNQASAQRSGQNGQQRAGESQRNEQGQGQQREGQGQEGAKQAREAADQMDKAAQAMKEARDSQVDEWKKELTAELDRSIQEMLQMAREESALEQKARAGQTSAEQLRSAQSSVQQGVDQTGQRLDQAGRKSSLLSGRSQRAMGEAQQKVRQAMQQLAQDRTGNGQGAASSLGEASEALNRAAASLARDRERANSAQSASGFSEMMQEMQELAQKQGSINGQAQGLMQMPGGPQNPGAQATARALARQQRNVAEQLDELSENAAGARAGDLAKEAKALAELLDGGRLDAGALARQQQLFRRLLDAGRALEKEEREDDTRREAQSYRGGAQHAPGADASGKAAVRFRDPAWAELRGLSPEERRAILDYFRRINGSTAPPQP